MSQAAKKIVFSGQVQGVGFRFTAFNIANRNQLAGFVRNLPSGDVEMLVQGKNEDIDDCIRDIKESMAGYIRDISIEEISLDPQHTEFKITF